MFDSLASSEEANEMPHAVLAQDQTSSSRSFRPTIFAARCKVVSVTLPSFGSRRRLIWLRLVFMRSASRLRERLLAFIASPICQASTSLMATASNSSSLPSPLRKSSRVESFAVERAVLFFFMSHSLRFEFPSALARQREVCIGRLLGLLDEAVKNQHFVSLCGEQHAGYPVAGKIATHLPQTLAHRAAERHADRPPVLHAHEVLADRIAISFVEATKPVAYDLGACARTVEDNGNF